MRRATLAGALAVAIAAPAAVGAPAETADSAAKVEEVLVVAVRIGSRIKRQVASPSPLAEHDALPPFVNTAGSYDPRSADPRGRRVFLRLEWASGG